MWTHFYDMHSGGGTKEAPYEHIYIEGDNAVGVFYARFGHHPHRITCTCCGGDYSISSNESLEELTRYHRKYDRLTLEQFLAHDDVLVIRNEDITAEERSHSADSVGGWQWVD